MSTAAYDVTGMTCAHCESSIAKEVTGLAGITDVSVSAREGRLTVTSAGALDDAAVIAAVDEAGYSAVRV